MERSKEHTEAEEKMYKVCGASSYENTLSKVVANVEKLQVCYLHYFTIHVTNQLFSFLGQMIDMYF